MAQDHRRSFNHHSQHEDRRDASSYDPRKPPHKGSYQNDGRMEPPRRHDINRSSYHRAHSRFDDKVNKKPSSVTTGRRSPTLVAHATSLENGGNSKSRSSTTMRQAGSPTSPPWHESELKDLVEVLCDKMWWRVQCEQEKKKEKKLCADRDRCPPGNLETGHYSDILSLQIEQCQKTKKKCSDRMSIAGDKFMSGIAHLLESYAPPRTQTPPASSSNPGIQKEGLDAALKSFRETIDASIGQRIQEETDKLNACTLTKLYATTSMHTKLTKETDELRKSLDLERQRNERLEKKLEDMERKFDSLSQRQDNLVRETASNNEAGKDKGDTSARMKQISERLDSISRNTVTRGELKLALDQFDDALASPVDYSHVGGQETQPPPSGSKTRHRLCQLSSAAQDLRYSLGCDAGSSVPTCIANLQSRISSCTKSVEAQFKKIATLSENLKTVEESISSLQSTGRPRQENSPLSPLRPTPPPPLSSVSSPAGHQDLDRQMAHVSKSLGEVIQKKMQEKLAKVAEELGSFVDKERREREEASNKADLSCNRVDFLRQVLDELRKYVHDSVQRLDGICVHLHAQLQHHKECMASFDSRLQHVAIEHARYVEEVGMQLRVLNTWQSNFTTKPLYRDIVEHINRTMPTGMIKQVSLLTGRVDAVERQMRSAEASTKKRKLEE